ncbi:KamA family radical SAM protein [Methanosarcinales archaeon]|nr:MAG: KamA family radical SAM protein [Methanosarcinales archaeon]
MDVVDRGTDLSALIASGVGELIEVLWGCDPIIYEILRSSSDIEETRKDLFIYLSSIEEHLFNTHADERFKEMDILERTNVRDCIRVFKNIIQVENEYLTGFSALDLLVMVAKNKIDLEQVNKGVISEFIYLFKGINGDSGLYSEKGSLKFFKLSGREAAEERTKLLDGYSGKMELFLSRYRTGLEPELIAKREELKRDILDHFGASGDDWEDYKWHIKHIIYDKETLGEIVQLESYELEGLNLAEEHSIPVQITPYYLSLFDKENTGTFDVALRAQVLPSARYCKNLVETRRSDTSLDFMDEESTSPIEGITRRYPKILILKPYDSCPQICVYCQRNWELKDIRDADMTKNKMRNAINLIRDNPHITEVLVTGGDPLTLDDKYIDGLLGELAGIDHIERIRIGTRTFVTLPFRFTSDLIEVLGRYHRWGEREVCMVTHFEHPAEVTPESLRSIRDIKGAGFNIYNQQVFTYYTSRRFETCKLRTVLKRAGIDPYYTFNTKGKDETVDFRVPIARMEQERKEEARLLPGVVRTDKPVFNVPRLGKSHLRAGPDHEIIMILGDGRRVYRFYPWESKFELVEPYNYTDVSIYDYLERLSNDREDVDEYRSIWYYF